MNSDYWIARRLTRSCILLEQAVSTISISAEVFVGSDCASRRSVLQKTVFFQERITILEAYMLTESSKEMRAVFTEDFPNSSIPAHSTELSREPERQDL